MKLFDLKERTVIVSPEALLVPEFEKLWKKDKTKDKGVAIRQLSFIYFVCDYRSPYRSAHTINKLESIVGKDFMKDENYAPDPDMRVAMEKYRELQRTPSMSLLDAAKRTVHNLTDYLESVDLTERDKNNRPVYKPSDVTSALKAIGGIVDSLRVVTETVQKEVSESGSLRGQRKKGNREDPR